MRWKQAHSLGVASKAVNFNEAPTCYGFAVIQARGHSCLVCLAAFLAEEHKLDSLLLQNNGTKTHPRHLIWSRCEPCLSSSGAL